MDMCVSEMQAVKLADTRVELLNIGFASQSGISSDFQQSHNIPNCMVRLPGSPWIVVWSGRRGRR